MRVVDPISGSKFRVPGKEQRAPATSPNSTQNPELETRNLPNACMAAAVDLEKNRVLVTALEAENRSLNERLATEKRTTAALTELNETRKGENAALRDAVAAKNETLAAKDVVIAAQDKLVAALKAKKTSPWRRLGDVLIGAAVFAILK